MPDTPPTYPPCEWPADGHVPPSGYRAEKHDWGERCGRPGSGIRVSPPMAIVLWSAQVCQDHADTARQSRLQLFGPDGQPVDGATPAPPRPEPTPPAWDVFAASWSSAMGRFGQTLDAALREAAKNLEQTFRPPRANRPINVASLRQVIDELRAYADAAPPAEPLAPETALWTALWTARLLDMPVGHLLAYAEQAGAERARDLGEIASECDDGTCPVAQAVHDALLEAGPWDRIDGDGTVASVLADHVTELGSWHTMGALLLANLDLFALTPEATIGDTICQGTTFNHRAELGELFDRIADRKSPAVEPADVEPDHLTPVTSDRGFRRFPPVEAWHGGRQVGEVSVTESSAATGPHLWLAVKDYAQPGMPKGAPTSFPMELSAHLPLVQAEHLRDQLSWLIEHHYQLDETPPFPEVAANLTPPADAERISEQWTGPADWAPFAAWAQQYDLTVTGVPGMGGHLGEKVDGPGALHVMLPDGNELIMRPLDFLTREGGVWRVDRAVPFALTTDDPPPAVDIGPIADAVGHHTPGRLVVGVDPATDDLPDVTVAIIPADGGPPKILPAPTVETFVVEPDPTVCPGSGSRTSGVDEATCNTCSVMVQVDADGFLEQHPASEF